MSAGAMSSNFAICLLPKKRPALRRTSSSQSLRYYRLRARLNGRAGQMSVGGSASRLAGVIAIVAGLILATANPSAAFEGRCLLVVDGTRYLEGTCNIELSEGGSFSIGAGETTRSKYFAFVNVEPGSAQASGFWNGEEAADRAHADLGVLERDGACWVNATARVCAWRSD